MTTQGITSVTRGTHGGYVADMGQSPCNKGKSEITVTLARDPPGRWMRFKAALSHLPVIGKLISLQEAQAQVEAYKDLWGGTEHIFRAGLVAELRRQDRAEVDALFRNARHGAKPLKEFRVSGADCAGRRDIRLVNNMAMTRYREGPAMMRQLQDIMGQHRGKAGSSPSLDKAIGRPAADFIARFMEKRCAEMGGYDDRQLAVSDIAAIANEALEAYAQVADLTVGLTSPTANLIFSQAAKGDSSKTILESATTAATRARNAAIARDAVVLEIIRSLPSVPRDPPGVKPKR